MTYQIPEFNLDSNIYHAFSTKEDGNMSFKWGQFEDVIKNRTTWLNKLNIKPEQCVTAELEHLTNIIDADQTLAGANILTANYSLKSDVLVTTENNLFLFLIVADCLPVLIYDPVQKVVGLVHASRVNTELNVIGQTINHLVNKYGCLPANLIIGGGPAINKCCYEFNNLDKVNKEFWQNYLTISSTKTYYLDFISKNIEQIKQTGVLDSHIFMNTECTGHSNKFFSHYRDQKSGQSDTGRFAALIGLKTT